MNPIRRAVTVAKDQVGRLEQRYPEYHGDLVTLLVQVVAKQNEGLSEKRRRGEVKGIITGFGSSVAAKVKEQ